MSFETSVRVYPIQNGVYNFYMGIAGDDRFACWSRITTPSGYDIPS